MTEQEEREYVEARWEKVRHADTALSVLAGPHYVIITDDQRHQICAVYRHTESEAWHATYLFTVERERQIAEVKEEIDWINCGRKIEPAAQRILAREQAALAELQRGMKI
jgi:hypothetical protein